MGDDDPPTCSGPFCTATEDVVKRAVGQGRHGLLCKDCADRERAIPPQTRATVPPEGPR